MPHSVNDTHVASATPSERVDDTSHAADTNAVSGAQVVDIEIDRGVQSGSVVEHKTRNADSLDARRFGAMFLDGTHLFMFERWIVRSDTKIDVWVQRQMLLWRWCPSTLKDLFGCDMPIVHHAQELKYLAVCYVVCGMLMLCPSFAS